MLPMLASFFKKQKHGGGKLPHILRKPCPVLPARSFSPQVIWRRRTSSCALQVPCALPTRYRPGLRGSEPTSGVSKHKASFRTSLYSANQSGMGFRFPPSSPLRKYQVHFTNEGT